MSEIVLNPRQVRAIGALLESDSQVEAARAARVGLRTLRRWLTEPAFADELVRQQGRIIAAVAVELTRGAVACSRALRRAGAGADRATRGRRVDPGRVAAARSVLDFLTAYTEAAGMVARLEAVERAVAARDQPRKGAN